MTYTNRDAWEDAHASERFTIIEGKRTELTTKQRWLNGYIGVPVFYQDWEMYGWGDFRHHCQHETPDEIMETRSNVTGNVLWQKNLQCKDCGVGMPKGVKDYFTATKRIMTLGKEPPMSFYMTTNWIKPGQVLNFQGNVNVQSGQFYLM
jgi:hypothetical protein